MEGAFFLIWPWFSKIKSLNLKATHLTNRKTKNSNPDYCSVRVVLFFFDIEIEIFLVNEWMNESMNQWLIISYLFFVDMTHKHD